MTVRGRDHVIAPPEAEARATKTHRPRASIVAAYADRVGADAAAAYSLLGIALLVGVIVRLIPLSWGQGFPLNDGGMFMAMVDDIKTGGYSLPEFTSYNGGSIPFAYPSLPFYTAAVLSDVFGWTTLGVLHYMPAFFAVLAVPAFYLLARVMLPTRTMAALAVLLFAITPRAFNWEIVGGGLTRSPALFFAILALWQGHRLFSTQQRRYVLPAAVLSALTIFCHMEMGWFVAFTMGYLALARGGLRRNLGVAIALAALVPVLTAPWWLETLLRVGLDPMLAAMQTGSHTPLSVVHLLLLRSTEEPFFPVVMVMALLGLGNRLQARDYFLPLWLLLIFVLDPRKAATTSSLPMALLGAWGLAAVFWPAFRSTAGTLAGSRLPASRWAYLGIGFLLLIYGPASAVGSASSSASPLFALAPAERDAMAWVRDNTPADARFLVMPIAGRWALDAPSEWFPALSKRYSVATVQGSEWLPDGRFAELNTSFEELLLCTSSNAECLDDWAAGAGATYDYLFVPRGNPPLEDSLLPLGKRDCCADLRFALSSAPDYERVFENSGATILSQASVVRTFRRHWVVLINAARLRESHVDAYARNLRRSAVTRRSFPLAVDGGGEVAPARVQAAVCNERQRPRLFVERESRTLGATGPQLACRRAVSASKGLKVGSPLTTDTIAHLVLAKSPAHLGT